MPRRPCLLTIALSLVLGAAAADAQPLDRRLQGAIDARDLDAALALAAFSESPPIVRLAFMTAVADCAHMFTCKVSLGKPDADLQATYRATADDELIAPVQGVVIITRTPADQNQQLFFPYGTVNGQQRILGWRLTAARLATLRAKATSALVEELLAEGIYDDNGKIRKDWKTAGKPLPAGGGQVGADLKSRVAAVTAAVKDQDPDAVVERSGRLGQMMFMSTDADGQEVPLKARQLKLRAHAVRFLTEVNVLGGYQLGSQTVLAIEGINGAGWVERGAIVIDRDDDNWEVAAVSNTITYPR